MVEHTIEEGAQCKALDEIDVFGRYLDVDGDGIGYRTLPEPTQKKGAFFTRGTSRDEFAAYTESPEGLPKKYGTFVE